MKSILKIIRKELIEMGEEKNRISALNFFKEKIKFHGVKNGAVSKISKEYYKMIKDKSKSEIFDLCDQLWKSGYIEESLIACNWSYSIRKKYEPNDFKVFEKWINLYVNNWASCDTFCNHTVGEFLKMYPVYLPELKKWAKSKNRWMRRAAAVSLIVPARDGSFLREIMEIADILLLDEDDLVQKGYGWMLKVASQSHQKEIFNYVMKKKDTMPRTALRYTIEKMPTELKAKAMKREEK